MKTADPELMRAINRFHVMDAVRRAGRISRTEITEVTELSPTTVSAITAALMDDGLIVPRQLGTVRDVARGRPRVMLELNPEVARVVGVKIAPHRIVYAVTDFRGDILADLTQSVRVDRQSADVIADLVEDGVRRTVADAGLTLGAIKSLCVALPGVVEYATGQIRHSPLLRDGGVPFAEALRQRLGLATLIESDANAIAVAEHWFRSCRDLDDFLVVALENTLGLAVMHGGQLFRGARGISFNLADLVLAAGGNGVEPALRLAEQATEAAILAPIADTPECSDAVRLGRGMEHALSRIEAGDNEVTAAAARAGKAIGIAVANLITLFAPPRVVLVGTSLVLGEYLLAGVRKSLDEVLPPWLADVSVIAVDEASDTAWARGAAAAALRELYSAPWGTTGPARRRSAARMASAAAK